MKSRQKQWLGRVGMIAALVVAFLVGLSLRGGDSERLQYAAESDQATPWTCSMHPQIQLPDPGPCPICGMDLIPVGSSASGPAGPRSLTLSASAQALAEIQTTAVERRTVRSTIRTFGKLEADETRIREIAARVSGRIDRLYINFTGVLVSAGQKLFDLYSPALFSAQEELLQAMKAAEDLNRSGLESTRRSAARTVEAARERLRLWGLTPDQIQDIESNGTAKDHITIVAPISGIVLQRNALAGSYVQSGMSIYTIGDLSVLWLRLDVYESDLPWLALGQEVEFQAQAFPGETFAGTVSFIDPVLDERSRSVKVRVVVDNPEAKLKPGMFVRAAVQAEVRGEDGELPLVVPSTAPLVTGTRAVVYVAESGHPGQYHGREVVLGPEGDGFYIVRSGLAEGELVVSNGAFKIDSALQILAERSMMHPGSMIVFDGYIPREFRVQVDEILAVYFDLSFALSHDDLTAAQTATRKLPHALQRPDFTLLPERGHAPWRRLRDDMTSHSATIANAPDIEKAREAFYHLSNSLIATVRMFRPTDKRPLYVFHCPMAKDNRGADWLQFREGTENPYYGSTMFKCGSKTETLVAGSDSDHGSDHNHH
jgi:Cu(I)/Ag(I) efflux system membrane fusion protein